MKTWSTEVGYFLDRMGCSYYLDYQLCREPAEEANYADYVNLDQTRVAAHTGDIAFGAQSGQVYNKLTDDIMRSQKDVVEFLLERYPVTYLFR